MPEGFQVQTLAADAHFSSFFIDGFATRARVKENRGNLVTISGGSRTNTTKSPNRTPPAYGRPDQHRPPTVISEIIGKGHNHPMHHCQPAQSNQPPLSRKDSDVIVPGTPTAMTKGWIHLDTNRIKYPANFDPSKKTERSSAQEKRTPTGTWIW